MFISKHWKPYFCSANKLAIHFIGKCWSSTGVCSYMEHETFMLQIEAMACTIAAAAVVVVTKWTKFEFESVKEKKRNARKWKTNNESAALSHQGVDWNDLSDITCTDRDHYKLHKLVAFANLQWKIACNGGGVSIMMWIPEHRSHTNCFLIISLWFFR